MRVLLTLAVALLCAGCMSGETTLRSDWFTYQNKRGCNPPDTNTKPSWQQRVRDARDAERNAEPPEDPAEAAEPETRVLTSTCQPRCCWPC